MLSLLLLPIAAFLIQWAVVITFNRVYVEDMKLQQISFVVAILLIAAALGMVAYVA